MAARGAGQHTMSLPGRLISGPLIASFGYRITAALYCMIGIAFTVLITVRWRTDLWRREAPSNIR